MLHALRLAGEILVLGSLKAGIGGSRRIRRRRDNFRGPPITREREIGMRPPVAGSACSFLRQKVAPRSAPGMHRWNAWCIVGVCHAQT
jgi:hypothetical protein